MQSNATLLIADHQTVAREGLRAIVESRTNLLVVGEVADGHACVEMTHRIHPDLVIIDMLLPRLNGVDSTRHVLAASSDTRVIGWSSTCTVDQATQLFRAGGRGYIRKDCAVDELLQAIEMVRGGERYVDPFVGDEAVDRRRRSKDGGMRVVTPREREVLQLIAEGHSTRDVASMLHVSVKTIETHRKNLMDKLNLRSVAGLTKYAIREGISSLDAY